MTLAVNLRAIVVAGIVVVALLPRVYLTVDAVIDVFPIDPGAIVFLHLDWGSRGRALFITAHACVAWFIALWWRGNATLWLKILTLVVLGELIAIYLMTLRFWYGGLEIPLY